MNRVCLFSLISSTLLMVLTVRAAERGSTEGQQREGAEIARAAESGSKEGEQGVGAEIARYVQTENSQLL